MSNRRLSAKVSEKGGVSVYGVRKFPITFYRGEWEALAKVMPGIQAFIQQHQEELSEKKNKTAEMKEGHTAL